VSIKTEYFCDDGYIYIVIGDSIEENRLFVKNKNGKSYKHELISDKFANEINCSDADIIDIRANKAGNDNAKN